MCRLPERFTLPIEHSALPRCYSISFVSRQDGSQPGEDIYEASKDGDGAQFLEYLGLDDLKISIKLVAPVGK